MSNKNFNDFFDEELKKQEEKLRAQGYAQNDDPFDHVSQDEKIRHQKMYQSVPEYNGQEKFLQRKSRGKKVLIASLVAVLMVVVYFLGYVSFLLFNPDWKFLSDIINIVEENGLILEENGDKYSQDWIYHAGNGILSSIDQYSHLCTPEEYYELFYPSEEQTDSNGLMYYVDDSGNYIVGEVAINSPAYQNGIFVGDQVIEITFEQNQSGLMDSTVEINAQVSVENFKNYINSQKIKLKVKRDDGSIFSSEFINKTDSFETTSIEYYFNEQNTNMSAPYKERLGVSRFAGDVGYIRVTDFMNPNTLTTTSRTGDFANAMNKFKQCGKKKLVLDLSYNTGGRNDVAMEIASYLVYDKNNPDGNDVEFFTQRGKKANDVLTYKIDSVYKNYFDVNSTQPNIVAVTNGRSASASELLLGAMLDYGTCVQVGTTTYGKGISQAVIPLKSEMITVDGEKVESFWAAYITTAKFYTPVSDECIHGKGFSPKSQDEAITFENGIEKACAKFA